MNLSAVAWSIAAVLIAAYAVISRRRQRGEAANRVPRGRVGAVAASPAPLPRRKPVRYVPAEPLRSREADKFAALVFAYRYVDIPEPSERSGQ